MRFVPIVFRPRGLGPRLRAFYYRWGLMTAARAVGFEAADKIAIRAGDFLWRKVPFIYRDLRRTIDEALQDTHDARRREMIARQFSRHLLQANLETEYAHRKIRRSSWHKHVKCHNLEPILRTVQGGGGVVGVSAYFGNHQIGMTAFGHMLDGKVAGIVSPIQHSTQQGWMAGMVRRRLAQLYPLGDAIPNSLRALRRGKLVFIIGEHLCNNRSAVEVEFLGKTQAFHPSAALLAARAHCPLAVLTCTRLDDPFQFELRAHDWIEPPARADRDWIRSATVQVIKSLERAILAHPAQYAWTNRHLLAGARNA